MLVYDTTGIQWPLPIVGFPVAYTQESGVHWVREGVYKVEAPIPDNMREFASCLGGVIPGRDYFSFFLSSLAKRNTF